MKTKFRKILSVSFILLMIFTIPYLTNAATSSGLEYGRIYQIDSIRDGCYVIGYSGTAEDIEIPRSNSSGRYVKGISSFAFSGCTTIKTISLYSTVNYIEPGAFKGCSNLQSILVYGGTDYLTDGYGVLYDIDKTTLIACPAKIATDTYEIPNTVTQIADYAFYDCSTLKSITIPDSVTSIGKYAFSNCTSLKTINIPTSLTNINTYTFDGCSSLKSITIPETITAIGSNAFSNCTSLEKIYFNTNNIANLTPNSNLFYNAGKLGNGTEFIFGNKVRVVPDYLLYVSDLSYHPKITKISLTDSMTEIGKYSFYGCSSLESLSIPDSISSIGSYAFSKCSSLSSIKLPANLSGISNYTFSDCSALKSITLPNSVTAIGKYALSGCSALETISIPDSVTSVGSYAFSKCSSLSTVRLPANLSGISDYTFSDCSALKSITLPNTVTAIGKYAFSGCSALETISIPDSVTSVGSYAFSKCSSLSNVRLPANLSEISDYTFSDCSALKSITLPNTVTAIGKYAFSGCSALETISIPDSVTSVGSYAFSKCSSLSNVKLPANLSGISDYTFSDCSALKSITLPNTVTAIGKYTFSGCSALETISIPDSVTSVGSYAFSKCSSLSNVKLPANLSGISDYTFSDCSALKSITLPNTVTDIYKYAFSGCSALETISIPDNVTSIGEYAFSNCSSLSTVNIPQNLTTIGKKAFNYCKTLEEIQFNALALTDFSTSSNIFYNAGKGSNGIDVIFGDNVKKIPAYLFYVSDSLYSPNIISVSIPSSVTSIGNYAFYNCTHIEKIQFNSLSLADFSTSSNVFYNAGKDSNGIDVIFGDNVKKIPAYLFYSSNSKIVSITIPNSVTSIGNYAFNGCTYLEKIHYNAKNIDNLTSNSNLLCYAGTAGNGIEVTFGSDVEKIPYYLLHTDYDANNPKIVSISLPDSLTTIDSEAFSGFNELISLNIPDTITSIGEKAFYNCTSLKNLNIPDSVTHIGNYAFAESCITQTKLTLPKTLETIGEGAFNGWSSLEEIKMPFVGAERGISGTKDAVFGHIFGITDNTENSTFQTFSMGGQNYQIPNTLRKVTVTDETIIPYGAFSGCGFLTDIVIEGSPSTIMSHAFSDYYNLFNVYVKSKTVKYSDTAFKYSEFPTLYGFTGSTTETFANDNSFDFVSIDDMEAETYNISAKTQVIENNIVFNVKTDKTIYDKMVHIAIYDDTQSLSDYIIIPNYDSFNEVNVVFKNRSDISFAKVFLWESPTSITPITEALRININ